ncbi:MAG TPA: HEAT repeat domain-containing protein [Longimicrobiales bacterium]|nr:HEAT repeat domain-containing protein [Longimicrobiales bacterium]
MVEAVRAIGHPDALPVLEAMLAEAAPSSAGLEPLLAAGTILAAHPEVRAPDWVGTAARQVEPALRERLEREDDTAAARLLGLTGSEAALQYLLELIGPPRRSEAALSGVLAVQPERRADAILRRLSEAGTEECIALLSLLPPLEADGRIRQLVPLLDHEVAAVRAAAAESLARAPAERALPLLFRHLDRQAPVPEVVRAVGNMGSGICHALLPLLEDESSQVRRAAADALSRCASQDVAGRLEDALDRETDPAATEALLRAYGRAGGAAAVPRLARALDEVGEAARLAVLDGLGATRAGDALPYLEQAIGRGAAESVTALRALGEIGGPAAARVVERWLVAEDLDVRRAAAAAATAVPEALSEGVVEALPDDPDVWIRICAARILARRPGSRERLERMADHDTSSAVRDEARRALNREG